MIHGGQKVAVITGAAGGIGRALIRRFLARNFKIWAIDKNPESLQEEFESQLERVSTVDVCSRPQLHCLATELEQAGFGLDVLVNNAGYFAKASALTQDERALMKILDVNLAGALRCTAEFGSVMAKSGGGRIIHIASAAGVYGSAFASAYAASKAGLIAAARSAAKELAHAGITVNVVAPGLTDTPMVNSERSFINHFVRPKLPLGRLARADEVAEAVEFLASCSSQYLTGAVVSVDGGIHVC